MNGLTLNFQLIISCREIIKTRRIYLWPNWNISKIKLVDSKRSFRKRLMRLRKEDNNEPNCSNRLFGITLKCQRISSVWRSIEEENNLLMDKIIGLKLKNNELMVNHGGKSGEVAEGRDSITSPGKTLLLFFFIVFLLNSIFYLYNFKS